MGRKKLEHQKLIDKTIDGCMKDAKELMDVAWESNIFVALPHEVLHGIVMNSVKAGAEMVLGIVNKKESKNVYYNCEQCNCGMSKEDYQKSKGLCVACKRREK
jgi:DNA-directed RNA polymerase subunit E'/Rpb7